MLQEVDAVKSTSMSVKGRVLLLCQHFYPEMISTGMHMTELALFLTRLGWQITVYCARPSASVDFRNPAAPVRMEYQGVHILRVPTIGSHAGSLMRRGLFASTYLLMCAYRVLRHAKDFEGLLVTTNPPFLGLVGQLAARLCAKPYILIIYDVYPDIAERLGVLKRSSLMFSVWEKVSRFIMNGAAANVVIGGDMAEVVRAKLTKQNEHTIHFIPNWSDECVVRPVPREQNAFRIEHALEGYMVVQYSGRMGRTHNLEPVIEAADILKGRKIIFQFIGDGPKRKHLLAEARKRNLTNVQFLPHQPLSRLGEVLSAADLAVVCLEGSFTGLSVPSKAYGAMAARTPLLGFLDPGSEIGQTILRNHCGLVLRDPKGPEVARLIEGLMDDPERLRAMGRNGYATFKKNYTLTLAATRYSDLMQRIFC